MTATPSCPDPDMLVQFVDDALGNDVRVTLEDHLDTCDDCRSTVSILARAAFAERRASEPAIATDRAAADRSAVASTLASDAVGLAATEIERFTGTALGRPKRRLRSPPQSPLAPGTKVARYVIGETLGVGGMGIVYSARDPDLNRDIAIKILRPEFARAHPDATKRIIREAQAMARVSHPNVVSVFDVATVDDRVFVAMERVSGTNLRGWLARERRTLAEILETFTAAGRGLIAAHDAGMVHRDFKPDNVLVGDDGRVRVTDFGLAYDQTDEEDVEINAESATRPIAGTPAYMAPEQHTGGNLDARTDQFSFAVALYEALYGQRPFAGANREALADAVQHGAVQPPTPGTHVPSSVRAILLRALAVTPGARFPTLSDLLKALARDRARRPRQVAVAALVTLLVVGVAFAADLIMRERIRAITRTSFSATRSQLDKLVNLRIEAFVAQSDALYRLPAVEEVAASRDLVDFGLGDPDEDRRRLDHIHANLTSANWVALTRTHKGDFLAIADQKGRLLFGSASPEVWGGQITAVPVIAAAYTARTDTYIGVIQGDDALVVSTGLLGGIPHKGLYVLFTRAKRIGPQPRAMFVQAIEAARLLDEVGLGEDTRLSLLAPDGNAEGTVPREVVDRAASGGIAVLAIDNQEWLAERTPLRAGEQSEAFAQIVLASESDVGLAGLFPGARRMFAVLAFLLAGLAFGALVIARRRDLTRASGRVSR
jgi:predicted Ser/Thr protein kinase